MHMKKKVISSVIALCLVLGSAAALPQNAFIDSTNISASAANTATSGKCGENVSWSLKDGVLTISGTGKMTDYNRIDTESPFYDRDDIKSVVIKSGVTSIGYSAFVWCDSLTSVTIPSSVTSIGNSAFDECTSLTSVTIPNSVISIGNSAFDGCTSLTSVTIPKSVTSIGSCAFYGCTSLANVTIPNSVTSIGGSAFSETKWLKNLQKNNPLVVVNGILIDGKKCTGTVTIPKSVTSIGNSAFDGCTSLTGVTIQSSVTSIGSSAFSGCTSLTSVTIPSSVKSIGGFAFSGTKWIENQQKNNPLVVVNGILIDGTKCKEKVTIPSSVTSIGGFAFYGNKELTSVTMQNGVKSIDEYAFYSCKNLVDLNISNSVTSIGNYAFNYCEKLTCAIIPNSVISIGVGSFECCYNLTSVSIPSSVKKIDDYAFFQCTSLKCITISSSVTNIGNEALGYYTIGSNFGHFKVGGFIVYGKKGSAAQTYAKDNGFTFVALPVATRLAGTGRYETAAKISQAEFTQADTVVLAYGMNYADALAGVSLAKAMNAPILLTNLKELPQETLAEIKRLKATNVVILGGPGAVGTEVEKALTDNNLTVERIAGASRFETATKIAEKMQKLNKDKAPEDVFFVYYNGFADALSVSTVAAAKGAPVIYLQTNGDLDAETAAYLAKIKGKVKNAYVIGGDGVISDAMMNKAGTALGLTPTRVFGADRFATCVAVNEKFAGVLNGKMLCVATGMDFPDALAGGVFAALNKAPLFLINGKENPLKLSDSQKSYLGSKEPQNLYVFGGTGVVSDSHVQTVADACG